MSQDNIKNGSSSRSKKPDPWLEQFEQFVVEFKGETDRAAVILGAAKLDYILYQILQKYLIPNVGSRDELLEGDSPLSSFSSKINICYRLGLIDAEFTRALHLIRKIRNAFAHEVSGCRLDSGAHRDRARELAAPFINTRGYKLIQEAYFEDKVGPSAEFFIILASAVISLDDVFKEITPLNAKEATMLYTSPWNEHAET